MALDKLTMFAIYASSSATLALLFFVVHYCLDRTNVFKNKPWKVEVVILSRIAGFTFLWYSISISFTLFNKWFLTTWNGGFSFSALYTAGHMAYKFIFSRLWQCKTGTQVEPFTWSQFLFTVLPIGVTTAIDIMFSNISLEYITITLYTITKTSVIAWTFLWALILKVETFKIKTFVIVCFICIGIAMAVSSPTKISLVGLAFCLTAAGAGGLRWAVTERLVKSNEQCKNPFVCLYHISPVSATFMIPVGLAVDFVPFMNSHFAQIPELAFGTFAIISVGGVMAFALILVEVKLVQLTSSLTMGVLGQLKELLQIILAIVIFKDEVTTLNGIGLAIALACVGLYKLVKRGENLELLRKLNADTESTSTYIEMEGLLSAAPIEYDMYSINGISEDAGFGKSSGRGKKPMVRSDANGVNSSTQPTKLVVQKQYSEAEEKRTISPPVAN